MDMLVNLTPKANYKSDMEQHVKELNRWYFGGCTKKQLIESETTKIRPAKFHDLFIPTKYTGVYYGNFDGDMVNAWCKQTALYGRKFFKRLRQIEDVHERIKYECNCWTYGVADNLEQIIDFYNRNEDEFFSGNHVISCFIVRKHPEEPDSGWRWHKWGPYIGTQKPRCEYLNNEPEIEKVICFSIYKVV